MEPCPDKKEILWLDVYGELDSKDQEIWSRHLESCTGCHQERERFFDLIQRIKKEAPGQELSSEEMQETRAAISQKISRRNRMPRGLKQSFGLPRRLVPALGGALVLVAALGWLGLREWQRPTSVQYRPASEPKEKMILNDLEVIRNLELLEEMGALQELVKVVDGRDT